MLTTHPAGPSAVRALSIPGFLVLPQPSPPRSAGSNLWRAGSAHVCALMAPVGKYCPLNKAKFQSSDG